MTKLVLNRSSFLTDSEASRLVLSEVFSASLDLSASYPNFHEWMTGKVIPGLLAGERSIVVEYRNLDLAGFAILKDTDFEQKLCCLRVMPNYQRSPIAIKLFESAFDLLENEKPLLSVSEEKLSSFSRIFKYFNFEKTFEYQDYYLKNLCEISFNGVLESEGIFRYEKRDLARFLEF